MTAGGHEMKRVAAVLAVAGLIAGSVPATAGAAKKPKCGGDHYIPLTHVKFPLC